MNHRRAHSISVIHNRDNKQKFGRRRSLHKVIKGSENCFTYQIMSGVFSWRYPFKEIDLINLSLLFYDFFGFTVLYLFYKQSLSLFCSIYLIYFLSQVRYLLEKMVYFQFYYLNRFQHLLPQTQWLCEFTFLMESLISHQTCKRSNRD